MNKELLENCYTMERLFKDKEEHISALTNIHKAELNKDIAQIKEN
jgi:hypothetical protein